MASTRVSSILTVLRALVALAGVLVGAQAIIVGTIEALAALIAKGDRSLWGALGAGILYVAFGRVLVFVPFAGAALLVQVGGVILLAYAAVMLLRAGEAMRGVTA